MSSYDKKVYLQSLSLYEMCVDISLSKERLDQGFKFQKYQKNEKLKILLCLTKKIKIFWRGLQLYVSPERKSG